MLGKEREKQCSNIEERLKKRAQEKQKLLDEARKKREQGLEDEIKEKASFIEKGVDH
jgi:hypothetical protein